MTDEQTPEEAASEARGQAGRDFSTVADRLGLYTPQGTSQSDDDIRSVQESAGADGLADEDPDHTAPKRWPEDY